MKLAKMPTARESRSGRTPVKRGADHAEIAKLAYRLFEKRGRQHGHETEDWLEAERQISGTRTAGNGAKR